MCVGGWLKNEERDKKPFKRNMRSLTVFLNTSVDLTVPLFLMKQVCHRDLKLENTLLDGSPAPRLKICDFGYSKVHLTSLVVLILNPLYICL